MNYRHLYHAGNFADVLKHSILCAVLLHLRRKETPFAVLDTHAGIGQYDLSSEQAQKTGEYQDGIARLLGKETPEFFHPLLEMIASLNPEGLRLYPGSPVIARHFLRPQDRLLLAELHPEDAAALKRRFQGDAQTAVHHRDGYEAMKALLPFPEKRGLALIDPPYESPQEYDTILTALRGAYERFRQGIFAIWYPVKQTREHERFHRALEGEMIPKILAVEMTLGAPSPGKLAGTGMILINPPWGLEEQLRGALPALPKLLGKESGNLSLRWLSPPD